MVAMQQEVVTALVRLAHQVDSIKIPPSYYHRKICCLCAYVQTCCIFRSEKTAFLMVIISKAPDLTKYVVTREISALPSGVDEVFALQGCYP